MLKTSQLAVKMRVRIFFKRRAIYKIRTFLTEFSRKKNISLVCKKFLHCTRKIQRITRDWLLVGFCQRQSLVKSWERLEEKYIRRMLQQYVELERIKRMKQDKDDKSIVTKYHAQDAFISDCSVIGRELKDNLKSQSLHWQRLNTKMNEDLKKLKNNGVLGENSKIDIIRKLLLPDHTKQSMVRQLIIDKRKKFFKQQKVAIQQLKADRCTFSVQEAGLLLHGKGSALDHLVHKKIDENKKDDNDYKFKPFNNFTTINSKVLSAAITKAYESDKSFPTKLMHYKLEWKKLCDATNRRGMQESS